MVRDVTEQKEMEARARLLMNELNHRVKNNLAIVQSIARQSLKGAASTESLVAFENRLLALAAAHNLLTSSSWHEAEMTDLVEAALRPFGRVGDRIYVEGPIVPLQSTAALALSMGLHELATNATKYGSLSNETGTVDIRWSLTDAHLTIIWKERGGPKVEEPQRKGFGLRMIERGVARELGATVTPEFASDGLQVTIVAGVNGLSLRPAAPTLASM